MGETKEVKTLEKWEGEKPVAKYRVELVDTPENRERVGKACRRLTSAITAGRENIAFGAGLKDGKIIVEADNLDLIPSGISKKK